MRCAVQAAHHGGNAMSNRSLFRAPLQGLDGSLKSLSQVVEHGAVESESAVDEPGHGSTWSIGLSAANASFV